MKAFILYLYRVIRWWFRCLWEGKIVPRKEEKLYSRSYMRSAWSGVLRQLDKQVNDWNHSAGNIRDLRERAIYMLLRDRRIMVAKRRLYRFE
jgi:hypothetical protein